MKHFIGVVESIDDPEKLGRAKVRCFGFHSESKTDIPTEDLPWAAMLLPVTSASISGISETPELLPGSRVFGIFLDSLNQSPLILGSLACRVDKKDKDKGFSDPAGFYPIKIGDNPLPKRALESYPFNKVKQTSSGHIIELDDTPGNERVHILHRTGSRIELLPNGDVILAFKNKSELNENSNISITGNSNISINGNSNILVNGNSVNTVSGNYSVYASRIFLNSSFGGNNASFVDNKAYLEPNLVEVGNLEEARAEVPEIPANKEQKDLPQAGTICAYEDGKNPYEYAKELLSLEWSETGNAENIKQIWEELNIYDPQRAINENLAWCAVFVGAVLKRTGNEYIRTAYSRNYEKYGIEVVGDTIPQKIANAQAGDILVFSRGATAGHVGFYTGEYSEETKRIGCLGGNQSNTLRVSYIPTDNKYMSLITIRRPKKCANTENRKIEKTPCSLPTTINKSDDLQSMALNLFHEARGEPDEGKIAVGYVVLNRMKNTGGFWKKTVSKVIYEPNQFSWTNDNVNDIPKESDLSDYCHCLDLARKILNGEVENPIGVCQWYHASYISSESYTRIASHHELEKVKQIGKHIFYKFKKESLNAMV